MNTALNRCVMRAFAALPSAMSIGAGGLEVAGAVEEEPQWDFGTCGKMHMVAVNSASDSVFDRNSDEDAGFFADNITLPVFERVGQKTSGDSSGGITDSRDTDWSQAGWAEGSELWSSKNWWSNNTTQAAAMTSEGQVTASPTTEVTTASLALSSHNDTGESGQGQKWLTRTYINVDSVGHDIDTGGALTATNEVLRQVARQCPDTRVILTGFSEGARVVSLVARQIGAGDGVIEPNKVAGVALFSDPLREDNQPVVASGADIPDGLPVEADSDEASMLENGSSDVVSQKSSVITEIPQASDPAHIGIVTETVLNDAPVDEEMSVESSVSSVSQTPEVVSRQEATESLEARETATSEVILPEGISSLPRSAPQGYETSRAAAARMLPGSFAGVQGPTTGGGISGLASGLGDFGALASKTVSWCIEGDLVCGMLEGSATRAIVDAVASQVNADNPVESLMAVADTLGPAVVLGGLESVAEDVSFGPGGFQVARASNPDETVIGRIATEATRSDSRLLGEMGARVLAASSKIAGMGLAAGITVARKTLTPSNLAAISAAGTSDPLLGIGVATAKFAEAALETVSVETATGVAGRVFDEVQAAGLNEQAVAQVATDAATWARLASNDSYASTPMTADGRSATAATVDWISALAGADSTTSAGRQVAGFDSAGAKDFLTHLAA
ncbi:cutinase family protein [Corynebacterium mastitidis]